MITELHWKDFELFISLIFDQTGWTRMSSIGGTQKAIDLDVRNWVSEERAAVQIKSEAAQAELDTFIEDFGDHRQYDRLVFAVHKPKGKLQASNHPKLHIWEGARLAKLTVQVGLGAWLDTKLA